MTLTSSVSSAFIILSVHVCTIVVSSSFPSVVMDRANANLGVEATWATAEVLCRMMLLAVLEVVNVNALVNMVTVVTTKRIE